MASELTVQTIKGPTSGGNANKILVPSGHTLDASAGTFVPSPNHTVQHLITQPNTVTNFTATSFADAAGFSITITPKYTNSKILIRAWSKASHNNTGSGNSAQDHRLMRDSTQIYQAKWQNYYNTSWATSDFYPVFSMQYIDTPSTTSAIIYKIQGRVYGGDPANRPWAIGDYNGGQYESVMEVLEIKQ